MRDPARRPLILTSILASIVLLAAAWGGNASADDTSNYVLTEEALNKTLGVLNDLRSKNLPINIGTGSTESEIASLKKQPKIQKVIKSHGLSTQEFVLTCKAAAQIREAENARDNWKRILVDPDASPRAKLDATQKLAESLKTNLFTPEQTELVRRRMPDLETLLPSHQSPN